MKISTAIIGIGLSVLFLWGVWSLGRRINYKLSYKDMVEKTITEMVKPEALK